MFRPLKEYCKDTHPPLRSTSGGWLVVVGGTWYYFKLQKRRKSNASGARGRAVPISGVVILILILILILVVEAGDAHGETECGQEHDETAEGHCGFL